MLRLLLILEFVPYVGETDYIGVQIASQDHYIVSRAAKASMQGLLSIEWNSGMVPSLKSLL
ncbi:hypothetical protein D1B31_23775 [Neobacillus notoginsengisoli]|uniref:Uncharacterized protein n=1 Tax=Neobacillus notoginsengisoli TaxID=1578198 RepID=A0A417YC71_9BACI|nr:hypothetical protein D1B31_23775 [Neobacillus notoginsengisoli]